MTTLKAQEARNLRNEELIAEEVAKFRKSVDDQIRAAAPLGHTFIRVDYDPDQSISMLAETLRSLKEDGFKADTGTDREGKFKMTISW